MARDAFRFGLYTGMRLTAVVAFAWSRVDMAAMTVRIDDTKRGGQQDESRGDAPEAQAVVLLHMVVMVHRSWMSAPRLLEFRETCACGCGRGDLIGVAADLHRCRVPPVSGSEADVDGVDIVQRDDKFAHCRLHGIAEGRFA